MLLSASLIWGLNVIVMKVILEAIPMYFLATVKVGISLLSVYILMKIKKISFTTIELKTAYKVSFFALTINFIFTFTGIKLMSGSGNAIMNALAPLITILLSFVFLHKRVTKRQNIAMAVAMIGFLFSIDFNIFNLTMGHALLFLGLISYSYANIIMQTTRNSDNYLPFTLGYLFLGFIQLLLLSLIIEGNVIDTVETVSIVMWLLFIAFSGIGFAYIQIVYLYSLKTIGSIKTSFFLSLNPIFTYLASLLFLKESISLELVISFGLMIIALCTANKISTKKKIEE